MDSILYDHSFNKIGAFGVSIYGNDCCRLMFNVESIFGELMDFVLASDSRIYGIIDHKIKQKVLRDQNHQYESIADMRHSSTCDFALFEKIKAK